MNYYDCTRDNVFFQALHSVQANTLFSHIFDDLQVSWRALSTYHLPLWLLTIIAMPSSFKYPATSKLYRWLSMQCLL